MLGLHYNKLEMLVRDKHSSLYVRIVSDEEIKLKNLVTRRVSTGAVLSSFQSSTFSQSLTAWKTTPRMSTESG
jgi:hypothetical protein